MATVTRLEPLHADRLPKVDAWGAALGNRRFRTLLLVLAGVPIGLAYIWYGLIWPLFWGQTSDFRQWYYGGARVLAAGGDPYRCTGDFCTGQTEQWLGAAGSIYPPFALWIVQPLTRFDARAMDAAALIAANLCLVFFLLLMIRSLEIGDWQERVLVVLACISFAPTLTEVQNRNFQLVLLALSAVVLMAWRQGDRWWGGLALGVGLALKLVEAPLLLLGAWGRRRWFVVAGAVTWAVLWLFAAPRLLPEYLFQVLPSVGRGSGAEMNVAPLGAIARALHPESLYLQDRGVDLPVLTLAAGAGAAVLLATAWRLRRPRADQDGRALEMAAAFAAMPLLVTVAWAGQLVLLLVPMIVLLHFGLRAGSRPLVAAVAASWLLIGPVYLGFTNAFAIGLGWPLLFNVWSDSALAGAVVLWVASMSTISSKSQESRSRP